MADWWSSNFNSFHSLAVCELKQLKLAPNDVCLPDNRPVRLSAAEPLQYRTARAGDGARSDSRLSVTAIMVADAAGRCFTAGSGPSSDSGRSAEDRPRGSEAHFIGRVTGCRSVSAEWPPVFVARRCPAEARDGQGEPGGLSQLIKILDIGVTLPVGPSLTDMCVGARYRL